MFPSPCQTDNYVCCMVGRTCCEPLAQRVGEASPAFYPLTFPPHIGPAAILLSPSSAVPQVPVSTPSVVSPEMRGPTVSAPLGPLWGHHLQDANPALVDLVADVASEEAAFH